MNPISPANDESESSHGFSNRLILHSLPQNTHYLNLFRLEHSLKWALKPKTRFMCKRTCQLQSLRPALIFIRKLGTILTYVQMLVAGILLNIPDQTGHFFGWNRAAKL